MVFPIIGKIFLLSNFNYCQKTMIYLILKFREWNSNKITPYPIFPVENICGNYVIIYTLRHFCTIGLK
jgi:hypothetical protein